MKNILFVILICLFLKAQSTIGLKLNVMPSKYKGICPVLINYNGEISVQELTNVHYRFLRSDGFQSPVEVMEFSKEKIKKVSMNWNVEKDTKGWASIEIIFPYNLQSKKVYFEVKCEEDQNSIKKPDLFAKIQFPISAYQGDNISNKYKILLSNKGSLEAKDFFLDLIILKSNKKGEKILCGRSYVSLIKAEQELLPSGLIPIIPLNIPPGFYDLCLIIDSTNSVEELNEENNTLCQKIKILKSKL